MRANQAVGKKGQHRAQVMNTPEKELTQRELSDGGLVVFKKIELVMQPKAEEHEEQQQSMSQRNSNHNIGIQAVSNDSVVKIWSEQLS